MNAHAGRRLTCATFALSAVIAACSATTSGSVSPSATGALPTQEVSGAPTQTAAGTATAMPSPTTTPGGSGEAPPCKTSQLTVALVDSSAAAGTEGGWLQFTDSAAPCSMQGWPGLVGVTASGSTTTAQHSDSELTFPAITSPPLVTLSPGDAAYAAFTGTDTQPGSRTCGPPYQSLQVAPPADTSSVVISAWLPYFNGYLPACAGIRVTFVIPSSARQ